MKHIKAKVHLLPTNNAEEGCILLDNASLLGNKRRLAVCETFLTQSYLKELDVSSHHIYITSDEEIKDGDYVLTPKNHIAKAKKVKEKYVIVEYLSFTDNKLGDLKQSNLLKIIATTDKSINICDGIKREGESCTKNNKCIYPKCQLPQSSQDFINKYIEKYNKGEQIVDVLVEYIYIAGGRRVNNFETTYYEKGYGMQPKTDKNNCITIKAVKDSWNREEHKMNLIYCVSEIAAKLGYASTSKEMKMWNDETNKWIEENLS